MTKTKLLFLLLLLAGSTHAQKTVNKKIIAVHVGYGTENNIGNPGPFAGVAYGKTFGDKLVAEISATYFVDNGEQQYPNSNEKYRAAFLSPRLGFHLIGTNSSPFRLRLSGGPALKWYRSKELGLNYAYMGPDGNYLLREPVAYAYDQGLGISVYGGLDFSFRLGKNKQLALFLDTYSREILLEHFMPGLKMSWLLP